MKHDIQRSLANGPPAIEASSLSILSHYYVVVCPLPASQFTLQYKTINFVVPGIEIQYDNAPQFHWRGNNREKTEMNETLNVNGESLTK